ncbi:hypothetical protein [Amycolatopsis rubida]|uniref:Uncharacterized protein n=1 Tax=Amycolatopsis rubida TaxID=112413 RepID=A0A1I6AH75_9PSEU|nr:hypothetical protein [Amycolatopsis rubida]SFQ68066.1 hypothetical protein SAMN05421854_11911 [Amycolatopsis rubida]
MPETVETSSETDDSAGDAVASYRETNGSSLIYAIDSDCRVTYRNGDIVRAAAVITADTLRNMAEAGAVEPASLPGSA